MVSIPALPMIFYIAFKMEHVAKRIFSFLDPFADSSKDGYQIIQPYIP